GTLGTCWTGTGLRLTRLGGRAALRIRLGAGPGRAERALGGGAGLAARAAAPPGRRGRCGRRPGEPECCGDGAGPAWARTCGAEMKFSYRFSNLLGTVYRRGNLNFTRDGNSVVSPVGNRVTVFDLKKSDTLPLATRYNVKCVGLSPDGRLAIIIDEGGDALLVSLVCRSVLHRFHFQGSVHSVCFSPDGRWVWAVRPRKFVVTKGNLAQLYHAPGRKRELNAFVLDKTYFGPYDETTCIDWTEDSRCFAVGSKDMSTWVFGAERWDNLIYYALGGHKDAIVGCFFESGSLDVRPRVGALPVGAAASLWCAGRVEVGDPALPSQLYTLSQDGALCVWQCDTPPEGLRLKAPAGWRADLLQAADEEEQEEEEGGRGDTVRGKAAPAPEEQQGKVKYSRLAKYFFNKEGDFNSLTAAAYHKKTHLLVTGFASGIFHLHELPEFNLIHSLSISDQSVTSVAVNSSGDWVAFGCSGLGQLLVWEWQSESYVLKQQGHFNSMVCLAYAPDGQYIATGGDDGKVKVWSALSGFCFVTFTEHSSGVTGVAFAASSYVVVTSSMDGTVRAFDLHRYRNFRTFTSPRPTQFSCVAVDSSGELVSAGAQDSFEVFVWSMQTGRLLDVLSGHEGPISGLCFNPTRSVLASASWDRTVRLWDLADSWRTTETLALTADGELHVVGAGALAVTFRPDGAELAVATLNAQITFWDPESAVQTGSIEGRHDLKAGRKELDKITAKHSAKGKAFTALCYSADGQSVLAGGMSRFVCIYHVKEQILAKKFEVSCNLSLDAMEEFLNRRKMTEFGNLALIDQDAGEEEGVAIPLPGVKKGDMSARHFKPETRVTSLSFSPTGRCWAATTTEGLLIYSLDARLLFDPFELDTSVTPARIRAALRQRDFTRALLMAVRLNEQALLQEALEAVPWGEVEVVSSSLPELYVEKVLEFLASTLEVSRHLEFYLIWTQKLLLSHGQKLKSRAGSLLPTMHFLQKSIQRHLDDVSKLCDWNRYTMQYALALSRQRGLKRPSELLDGGEEAVSAEDKDEDDSLHLLGVLVHLSRAGADVQIFAPDIPQMHVVDHTKGQPSEETRNVLTESARIARGKITNLAELSAAHHDAAIFPGGFGAAKNLSTFAVDGKDCTVNGDVARVLKEFHGAGKPIGLCCIAPVLAAKVLRGVEVTVGHEQEEGGRWPYAGTTEAIKALGAKHCAKDAHVDQKNKVVTTPAFMCETALHHVHDGIGAMVREVLKLAQK
ncbi:Periodic tryptophan protein 2, partial [Galemys pyrenaicus]